MTAFKNGVQTIDPVLAQWLNGTVFYVYGSQSHELSKFRRICTESSQHGLIPQRQFAQNASFLQVGLLDVVFSEYPDKSHNFTNLFVMTSHFRTLLASYIQGVTKSMLRT